MKRMFLVLVGAMMIGAVQAQVVTQDSPALVYYFPKTQVVLDYTYQVETQEMGPYARYAQRLLGVTEVVTETKSTYSISDVDLRTRTVTDFNRPHVVVPEEGVPTQLLRLNEKGVLVGFNVASLPEDKRNQSHQDAKKNCCPKTTSPTVAPFMDEAIEASTQAAQAEAIAKQILTLRENRSFLLSGEAEHMPADGKAIQVALEELNRQEQALTALFVGTKSIRTEHKSVVVEPNYMAANLDDIQEELSFFSKENGFTDGDNIDADTLKVRLFLRKQILKELPVLSKKEQKKYKAPELSQIVYNLPGHAIVRVEMKGHTLFERTIPVAQLGVDVPLSKELFKGTELPVIIFSEKTGNVISISK